jgi:hypothetical protein
MVACCADSVHHAKRLCEHAHVPPNLDGVRVKLARAKRHLKELRTALAPMSDPSAFSTVRNPAGVSASTIEYRVVDLPVIDPMVGAIVGDVVHNLRSALDHVAWQLVLLDGGQPNDETTFPLHETRSNRKGNPRQLTIKPGIRDPRIMAAVEAMQPFSEANYGRDPATDALGIIRRLDNIDKHRLLLPVVHTIDHDMPAYWGSNEGDPSPTYWFDTSALESGDVVAMFNFGDAMPPDHFDPHIALTVTIDELDANWARGRGVVDVLDGLRRGVSREINLHIVPLMNESLLDWD